MIKLTLSALLLAGLCAAQETRGTIQGRVLDPSQASVAGASVLVESSDTNIATKLTTNSTGYYEARLLLPGNYRVSAEFSGFKKTVRSGLVLRVSGTLDVDLGLEVGGVAETVSVSTQVTLLESSSVSSGRVLENRDIADLPVVESNMMELVKMTPGLYTSGANAFDGPHSIQGASDYSNGASVGGNEWSIDGVPSNGSNRNTAYLPHTDTVEEMKVETSNFDASTGHTTGASITLMTKAGANQFHGTLTEQHWQQRWQGTNFFTRQLYFQNIAAAEAAGNHAAADDLRSQDKQAGGRSNNYAGTIGGPIRIPKIYDGRNRLFFFFSYQGNKDNVADLPARINVTVPTMAERTGDFSRYLQIDPVRYQIYDPLSVRVDPARAGHFIRTPFSGNIIPQARAVNPMYAAYLKFMPATNNDYNARKEPIADYLSSAPLIRDYKAYGNRIDFHPSDKHRFFGRWTWNDWSNYAFDWTYTTLKGLQSNSGIRQNFGATADWVYTINPSTVLDVAFASNEYIEGNNPATAAQFKPSDVGLPTYLDQRAGDQHILPVLTVTGYNAISFPYPSLLHYRTLANKADLTHVRGSHSVRAGMDMRNQYRTGGGGGNTSGSFTFNNAYTRRNDDTFTPAGDLGLGWAAFMLGLPSAMSVASNDSAAMVNPYYGWYGQDTWRLTRKLTINLGLRMEYEKGPTERYNRMLSYFDPSAILPITDASQAAYARSPIPELDASKFVVRGGSTYAGDGKAPRNIWKNELMWLPRVGGAYQVDSKTVIRAGYGLFYDTLNVLNLGPDQTGYSRTTSTTLTTDFGTTWLAGNPGAGVSPLTDPFPVRSDGTRFDEPTGNKLGLMAKAGRGWSYTDYDYEHAHLHRWRADIQRQIGSNLVLNAAYIGERAGDIPVARSLSPLAAQYWASGMTRNDTVASNLNANVTNPFRITNFAALQSDPLQYSNLNTLGFFTGATIPKNRLLRAYPQMNLVTQVNSSLGKSRTDALQVTLQRRFAQGFNLNVGYTRMRSVTADYFANEFDADPSWRESNDARPHRFVATGIYQFPFGKGHPFARSGPLSYLLGGFQVAATYEWSPGPLLNFGNLFYYGDLSAIANGPHTLEEWFNTDNFERNASKMPAAFQTRVFPTHVDGVRADSTNQWNANIQREFQFKERVRLQIRVDALNLQNRTQFAAPNPDPASTNFGRITAQSGTTKRLVQVQARIRF